MKNKYILYLILLFPICVHAQDIFQDQKIVAGDRAGSDQFGGSVAISGDYAVVGSRFEDEDVLGTNTLSSAGSAYIYEKSGSGVWVQVQKIVASNRGSSDLFGTSVAISGDYLVVGASLEDSGGTDAGSAYIFERNGSGTWVEVQRIEASDNNDTDNFGVSVSIFGNIIVVGANNEDEDESGGNTRSGAGSAYIFERDGMGTWNETQKIVASDRNTSDSFGFSVSIYNDIVVVGAHLERHNVLGGSTLNSAGSAYIFEKDVYDTWTEVQKIVASDRGANDLFGSSVDVSGNYIIIGARAEDEDASGGNTISSSGSAYIFERNGSGVWNQIQKIVANDRGTTFDQFGCCVSISGGRIAVGARGEDEDASGGSTLSAAGAIYVFGLNGNGVWSQEQKIVASDRGAGDFFGDVVAISNGQILVGARSEDEDVLGASTLSAAGSAYFYDRNAVTYSSGSWSGGSGFSNEPTAADSGKKIIISNGTATLTQDVEASNVIVASGATLILPENYSLIVTGTISLNDTEALVVESGSLSTGNLVNYGIYNYNNNASVKVERYIPFDGANNLEAYHYIGSPIDNHAKFTDMSDLYAYRESDLTWLHHQGFTDGFDNFSNGMGYAIRYPVAVTKAFTGEVNNGNYAVDITLFDNGGNVFEGFNLIANPYSSSISSESFVTANSSFVGSTLYFWNGVDYATYNTSLGSGTAGTVGAEPDGNISSGQAFLAEATNSGTSTVVFNRTMRGTDSNIFYKKTSFPQLRLLVTSGEEKSDLLLTGHHLSSIEVDEYDTKQLEGDSRLSLGSLLYGSAYDIESVPELSGHHFDLIVTSKGTKEITFRLKDMVQLDGKRVYLEDKEEATLIDITEEGYTSHIASGEEKNRFKLHIIKDASTYNIWVYDGMVNIFKNGEALVGKLTLSGIDGKIISVNQSNYINNWNTLAAGIYILEFENKQDHYITKLIKE